jgi:multifunctional methyltransferase subunit TRM112
MKILTVNFLTCAVKSCKATLSTNAPPANQSPPSQEEQEPSPSPFPLHFRDAVLERTEIAYNPRFIQNILPRVNWEAMTITARELGLAALLPERNPIDEEGWGFGGDTPGNDSGGSDEEVGASTAGQEVRMQLDESVPKKDTNQMEMEDDRKEKILKQLHTLLLETSVSEGKLVCGKCGFEYPIKEGVGNFLLPAHLGTFLSPAISSLRPEQNSITHFPVLQCEHSGSERVSTKSTKVGEQRLAIQGHQQMDAIRSISAAMDMGTVWDLRIPSSTVSRDAGLLPRGNVKMACPSPTKATLASMYSHHGKEG